MGIRTMIEINFSGKASRVDTGFAIQAEKYHWRFVIDSGEVENSRTRVLLIVVLKGGLMGRSDGAALC